MRLPALQRRAHLLLPLRTSTNIRRLIDLTWKGEVAGSRPRNGADFRPKPDPSTRSEEHSMTVRNDAAAQRAAAAAAKARCDRSSESS